MIKTYCRGKKQISLQSEQILRCWIRKNAFLRCRESRKTCFWVHSRIFSGQDRVLSFSMKKRLCEKRQMHTHPAHFIHMKPTRRHAHANTHTQTRTSPVFIHTSEICVPYLCWHLDDCTGVNRLARLTHHVLMTVLVITVLRVDECWSVDALCVDWWLCRCVDNSYCFDRNVDVLV